MNRFRSPATVAALSLLLSPLASARLLGIDVASFQGTINWDTVAADPDVNFAFLKATEGVGFTDSTLARNLRETTRVGLATGVYHFARPDTGGAGDAVREAEYFVAVAGAAMGEGFLPPVLDIEVAREAGRSFLTSWSNAFLNRVETLSGVRPIVYASEFYAEDLLDAEILDTQLWVANYTRDPDVNPTDIRGWPQGWLFHQYTDRRRLAGIGSEFVDSNVFDGDLADLDALRFSAPIPEPAGALALAGVALLARRRRA